MILIATKQFIMWHTDINLLSYLKQVRFLKMKPYITSYEALLGLNMNEEQVIECWYRTTYIINVTYTVA